MQPATAAELSQAPQGECSAVVARRVAEARGRQSEREGVVNAEADPAQVALSVEARSLVEQACDRMRLSPRGYTRVLRVARTVADLAGVAVVQRQHVAEALRARSRG